MHASLELHRARPLHVCIYQCKIMMVCFFLPTGERPLKNCTASFICIYLFNGTSAFISVSCFYLFYLFPTYTVLFLLISALGTFFKNIFFIHLTVAPTDVASAVGYVNLRLTNQTNSSLQNSWLCFIFMLGLEMTLIKCI